MDQEKDQKNIKDKRLVFGHKNLQRWALFSTTPNMQERVLSRYSPTGEIIEKVIIGSVVINGKPRTLAMEEGSMMNLIEMLHNKYRPTNGVLRVPTTDFYDFMVDISSFRDTSKRKHRDAVTYRNYTYDRLYALTAIPIMYTDWKEKDGVGGAQRFNLLDGFKLFGKTKDAEWGIIEITINPVVAAGLRAQHTSPFLIEVANSFKTSTAWVMYRYLDKVLAKRTKFEIKMDDYAKRLVMPEREDKLLLKIQAAVKEMENKDLTSGRITVSKLEKRENIWWIWIERGRRSIIKKEAATTTEKKDREEMDQFEMRVYRYDAMSLEERQPLDLKIQERLSLNKWGKPGNPSYEFTRQAIIAQVMEEYLMDGIDEKGQNICTPPPNILIAKEPPAPGSEYGSDQEQKQKSLKKLALILSRVYYSKVNHNIIQKNNTLTN